MTGTTRRDTVAIGASAGGLEALLPIVRELPGDLPAALLVVVHLVGPESALPGILERAGTLGAVSARDGARTREGCIYVAPPDYHMLVERDHVLLTRGPRENYFRPSIDTCFRSAAVSRGSRVVGVVLSGMLDDGAAGAAAIKAAGGVVIVQAPADARHPAMPESALAATGVDHCVPAAEIAGLITRLSGEPAFERARAAADLTTERLEGEIAKLDASAATTFAETTEPTEMACPECHGALRRVRERGPERYRHSR